MNKNQPNLLIAFAIVITLFALQILIGAGFYDAGIIFKYGDPQSSVISVLSTGIIITASMHFTGLTYPTLFHSSINSVSSTVAVLFPPIFIVILGAMWWFVDFISFIALFMPEDKASLDMLNRMMSSGFITIIAICVIAPLLEEMLFRGIILRGFLSHYSPKKSIILSALLFGIFHLNLYQIPAAFFLGCFFGGLYYFSRSLWPSIFAHAIYNGGIYMLSMNNTNEFNSFITNIITFIVSLCGILLLARIFNIKLNLYIRKLD
ncbi:CPBP family intramembrane glutamic endopeptidase [Psychromonas aquimarina]|uniref:CPBP family intramembrane glutamic endopeptidase n=1 Tax=Psychromonas aquimarina TaxID=444919 RepID=UPI0003FD96EE|nr:type II CAAX endopeptidase family protein [Psychromonas aquimarina]